MKYIIFIWIIPFIAYSQSNIEINRLEISDLSSQKINNLNLDNRNFNWISTNEGLNRFDGINNTIFRSNPFDNKTISNNSSKSVFQIDNDGVFITTSSGLDYFNYEKLEFERIESKSSPTSFYSYDNYVFIPTEEEGLFIYDTKNDSILDDLKFDPRNPLSIS